MTKAKMVIQYGAWTNQYTEITYRNPMRLNKGIYCHCRGYSSHKAFIPLNDMSF